MKRPRRARGRASPPGTPAAALVSGAVLGGMLVLASLPPVGCGWLMWFALVPLFALHDRVRTPTLLLFGYLLAAVPVGTLAFCVAPSSVAMFAVLALLVPLAFAAAIVAATLVESRIASPWARVLVFPCFGVAIEHLLGSETVGVPVTMALTQADYPVLIQNADLFGTAATTFLLLLANRSWPLLWRAGVERLAPPPDRRRAGRAPVHEPLAPATVGLILFALNLGYGGWALGEHGTAEAPYTVAAVQPMIPTSDYVTRAIDRTAEERIDDAIEGLVADALATRPDLLVLPEGGDGRYNFRIPARRRALEAMARKSGAGLMVSSPDMNTDGAQYNAVFSLARDGHLLGFYRKRLLTPVGEAHLQPGVAHAPVPSAIGPVGTMVCFESCFSGVARSLVEGGAGYLLVSTSDASFRNSALGLLHSRFSVFRAIETRRYVVQASNMGPSLVVRPTGELDTTTRFLARGVLSGRIGLRTGRTPFVAFGWLVPLAAWLGVATLLVQAKRGRAARRVPRPVTVPSGARIAGMAAGYAAAVGLLACTSIHLATRGTVRDRGPIANIAAFLAPRPALDVGSATADDLQRDSNTCGPAALAFLLRTYGVDVPEREIAARVHLEDRGTTMLELVRAAEHLGFRAWGERWNLAALREQPTPTVAYLTDPGHFVVVLGVDGGWVFFFDPARGAIKLPERDFARLWNGYTVQVRFAAVPELDDPPADPAFRSVSAEPIPQAS